MDGEQRAATDVTTRNEERETGRVEAFSDGVFAIAVTLLVLLIPIPVVQPGHSLAESLGGQIWAYIAYVVSFLTILVMWINHHNLFRQVVRADRAFLILNGLLLMVVTFIDYPTALVARYFATADQRTATLLYAGVSVLMAICFYVLWFYASRGNRLLGRRADPAAVAAITRAFRFGPLIYVVIFLIAFLSPAVSLVLCGVMAVYYAIYGRGNV